MSISIISPNITTCGFDEFIWLEVEKNSLNSINSKIKECTERTENNNNSTIIGYMVWESKHPKHWIHWVRRLLNEIDNRNFVMVLNTHYKFYDFDFPFEVVYIDFFILRTWYESALKRNACGYNKEWNTNASKFLFLFGKLQKPHRIRLLYKLYENNLLDSCIWSLRMPQNNSIHKASKDLIPELSLDEFNNFIKSHEREPDEISTTTTSEMFNYGGFPYDKSLFSKTLFRLSPETYIERILEEDNIPWVTEKTWITILNNHPFVLPGETGILKYLQDKGFRTFNKYLPVDNYDELCNVEDKLNSYITNVKYLLDNNEHNEHIREDIEYNFHVFKKLIKVNEDVLYNLGLSLGLPDIDVYRIIPLVDDVKNAPWISFYNSIKDKSWPSCLYEEDFIDLPKYIKDECIDIFQYVPLSDK